jgi:hypothetical protein
LRARRDPIALSTGTNKELKPLGSEKQVRWHDSQGQNFVQELMKHNSLYSAIGERFVIIATLRMIASEWEERDRLLDRLNNLCHSVRQ